MTYATSREEALARVKALALRVLADRLDHGETIPELTEVFEIAHEPVAIHAGKDFELKSNTSGAPCLTLSFGLSSSRSYAPIPTLRPERTGR